MKIVFILLSVVLLFCSLGCSDKEVNIADLPSDGTAFQKMLIAQLSGNSSIASVDGEELFLNSRWNSHEKQLTRAYLKAVIRKLSLIPIEHSYQVPNLLPVVDVLIEPLRGKNIYTVLPATEKKNEYVIIGAHYDTGGKNVPGAIDNGSGMALIFEILRKVKMLKDRRKNLMVVFFDQEEDDISAGSTAFAAYLNSSDLNVHSVHTFDLIGWDGDHNREIEIELPNEDIERRYRKHASELNIPIYVSTVNSSDHYSFIQQGINAVGVSQAYAKGDNSGKKDTPADKFHLVNFEYLQSSTQLAYQVIEEIIND